MTLDDIIRRDEDRVFAVDPECFIIFTVESLSDTRPFIRVGNWIDLPAELIPLVENIIVTDTMAGNPAHEQFNIDIKYLPVNRYIGSHSIVRRYLDYQKVFGLDLRNASVVDAERDIPDISTSSAVSDRESFMGIFYNDGNFRIVHSRKRIFDLKESCDSPLTSQSTHNRLAASIKNQKRYAGCGMVIIDGNPMWYRASAFASYLFPLHYYSKFGSLGVNPRSIQTVIHPSQNFLPLARFLKWKHGTEAKLTLYSDSKEETALQKSLFSRARIEVRPFSGIKGEIIPGVAAEQKFHSFNIGLSHNTASGTLRTAFIKGPSALSQIAKERYDAIFVPYAVFEDCVSALRSSKSPVVVIDDGNPSVAKVPRLDYAIVRQNAQYEFIRAVDGDDALRILSERVPGEIAQALIGNDSSAMAKILSGLAKGENGYDGETALNTAALVSYLVSVSRDRKVSAELKSFARELYLYDSVTAPHRESANYRFELVFTGTGVFETAFRITDAAERAFFPDELRDGDMDGAAKEFKNVYARILEDRKRLQKLLSLYHTDGDSVRELASLREEIEKRKEAFRSERSSHPEKGKAFIHALRSSVEKVQRKTPHGEGKPSLLHHIARLHRAILKERDASPAGSKPKRRTKAEKRSLRHLFVIVGVAFALTLSAIGIIMLFHSNAVQKKLAKEQARVQTIAAERERLKEQYGIRIDEYDVYLFANKTAQKNGYAPIPVKDINKKNPHWIFPGNVFTFPDGEEVRVKEGDTLWKISRAKLERLYIDFYVVVDAIRKDIKSGKKPDPAAVRTAQSLAITPEQKKLAAELYGNK